MRKIFYILLIHLILSNSLNAQNSDKSLYESIDFFYKNYVTSGLVDYKLIKLNFYEIDSLVKIIGDYSPINGQDKKAFLINAYNIFAIKQLADAYPVKSPQDVKGFYDNKIFNILGKKISLNDIENIELRKEYKDPRLHFVLVCGALGCPPIINESYTPENLETQLTNQTKLALNNDDFLKIESSTVLLSEIFKWYEDDFTRNQKVISFINQYREVKIPFDFTINYYPYDWRINEYNPLSEAIKVELFNPVTNKKGNNTQEYTPSVLYKKGQWEYKFFNNLYTQTKGYDNDGNRVNYGNRSNYFTSINQFLLGINSKINIGADVWINSVRVNDSANKSPFNVLRFENSPNTRTEVGYIGPKIKIIPFKNLSHLSFQTTFLIPIANDMEGKTNGKPYLSRDSYISITQIFYDYSISSKFQLFFQLSPWIYIAKEKPLNETPRFSVSSPASIFFSYFPTERLTFYMQQEFWPNYGSNGISSWFRQEGFGMKVQILKGKLEAETSYTRFSMGENSGAGQTFNFGLRLIHL
jgi:hypothetical protein